MLRSTLSGIPLIVNDDHGNDDVGDSRDGGRDADGEGHRGGNVHSCNPHDKRIVGTGEGHDYQCCPRLI